MNRLNGASKTKARASFVMVNCYWENGSAVVLICITHSPTHTPCLLSFIRSFFFSKISVRINDDGRTYSSLPTATSSSAHPTRTLHQILHGSAVVCRARARKRPKNEESNWEHWWNSVVFHDKSMKRVVRLINVISFVLHLPRIVQHLCNGR